VSKSENEKSLEQFLEFSGDHIKNLGHKLSVWTVSDCNVIASCDRCGCNFTCKTVLECLPVYYYVLQDDLPLASSSALIPMYATDLNLARYPELFCKKVVSFL
jgi:hypothetical protein